MNAHDLFPLEQLVTCPKYRTQRVFAKKAIDLLPEYEDTAFEATRDGLRILGMTEADLLKPKTFLMDVFGPEARFAAPHIRLAYADGWQEPVMGFRIATESSYLEPIRKSLTVRGASISDIEKRKPTSVIRGEAPLLDLLGFSRTLRELSRESAEAVVWLSHYQPLWSYSSETMACYQG
ncbi:hypothetical protein MASR1M60_20260 [Rhodocyclaceae bacterium]